MVGRDDEFGACRNEMLILLRYGDFYVYGMDHDEIGGRFPPSAVASGVDVR